MRDQFGDIYTCSLVLFTLKIYIMFNLHSDIYESFISLKPKVYVR